MKNLTKLLLVVVALFAYSCTTVTTDDLGIELGGGKATTIELSLESSRTQLGVKGEEIYPLYWSEGDQISVNGVASVALTAEQAGSAKATFTVAGALQTPYCIAYPAATNGKVLFAENQRHTSNTTFGNGVSTMYAFSEDGIGAELHHLTGVLKVGVTGSATLSYAQISTIDRKAIAGEFDFDFANGVATATEASKPTINYSFGEGVALSNEPTFIHVAVPAGEYSELYVTLYDKDGGVMYATVKADDTKPLTAGNVREFSSNITYAATDNVFVIKDRASLKAFAEQAATLTKDLLFVADVDMTDEAWTPIEGYAGTINGNGYAIKGLTAPLFNTTSATIKGLHLRDLNISVESGVAIGTFANTYNGALISHCSTSGKLTVTNLAVSGAVGGFFGKTGTTALARTIENCKNDCDIKVTGSSTGTDISGIGGFVGIAASNTGKLTLSNNENTATISADGTMAARTSFAGFIGYVDLVPIYINDCHNSGAINVNYTTSSDVNAGGIWGRLYRSAADYHAVVTDCLNSGAINIATNTTGDLAIGGCFGVFYFGSSKIATQTFDNCDNSGAITIGGEAVATAYIGGLVGYGVGFPEIKNCDNLASGEINYAPTTTTGNVFLAGLSGYYRHHIQSADYSSTFTDCNNYADIKANKGCAGYYGCGGIIGYFYTNTPYSIGFYNVNNYGSVIISGAAEGGASNVYMGGLVAVAIKGFADVNAASVVTFSNCHSHSTEQRPSVLKVTNGDYGGVYAAGIFGYSYARIKVENCSNSQPLIIDANKIGSTAIGPLCGKLVHQGAKLTSIVKNFSNTADYTITPKTMANVVVSMFLGYFNHSGDQQSMYMEADNVTNSGDLNVSGDSTSACYYGGFCGYARLGRTRLTMTNSTNSGDINIGGSILNNLLVGGLVGTHTATQIFTNVVNEGDINIDVVSTSTATAADELPSFMIGGIIGNHMGSQTSNNCYNKGNITFTGSTKGKVYVGGHIAYHNATLTMTDSGNTGNIFVGTDAKSASTSILYLGGVAGAQTVDKLYTINGDLVNTGDISVINSTITDDKNSYVGGIFGLPVYSVDGATCYSKLKVAGLSNVGMILGTQRDPAEKGIKATNCKIGGATFTYNEEEDEYVEKALTASDFHKYIYANGDNTDWTGTDNYDGCTFLSTRPTL
ncbi:MAG: hypothetical protein IIX40_00080 [Alistipes sp.]|nr:hypothetical protein [Alistipes sp.]